MLKIIAPPGMAEILAGLSTGAGGGGTEEVAVASAASGAGAEALDISLIAGGAGGYDK